MTQIEKGKILEIINSAIPNKNITEENIDDNLAELGMDSITFIQIVVAFEEEFNCVIPDEKLLIMEMNTIQKMIDVLQSLYDNQDSQQSN